MAEEEDDNGPQAEDFLWSIGVGEALPEWLKELRKKERAQGLNQGPRQPGRAAPRPGFGPAQYGTPSPAAAAAASGAAAGGGSAPARAKASTASSAAPSAAPRPEGAPCASTSTARAEAQGKHVEEKRIDPEDGKAYLLAELLVRYEGIFSVQEIEAYFKNDCKQLPAPSLPAEAATATMQAPAGVTKAAEVPTADPVRDLGIKAAEVPTADPVRDLGIKEWLLSLDDGGFMAQYHDTLTSNFDSLEQIRDIYVKGDELQKNFFDDVGIKKLGHKRLFEKWFKEHTL